MPFFFQVLFYRRIVPGEEGGDEGGSGGAGSGDDGEDDGDAERVTSQGSSAAPEGSIGSERRRTLSGGSEPPSQDENRERDAEHDTFHTPSI